MSNTSYNVLDDDDLTAKEGNLIDLPPLIQPTYAKRKGHAQKKKERVELAKDCQEMRDCPVPRALFLSDVPQTKTLKIIA